MGEGGGDMKSHCYLFSPADSISSLCTPGTCVCTHCCCEAGADAARVVKISAAAIMTRKFVMVGFIEIIRITKFTTS